MKLFIWEDVLTDYTSGLAVAYAETLEEALALFPPHVADQLGRPTHIIDTATNTEPMVAFVHGGS